MKISSISSEINATQLNQTHTSSFQTSRGAGWSCRKL